MTMSYKCLTQISNTSNQLQLVIAFDVRPDLGPDCLNELLADENVI